MLPGSFKNVHKQHEIKIDAIYFLNVFNALLSMIRFSSCCFRGK